MANPGEGTSLRNRWFSQSHSEFATVEDENLEKKIVQQHLSEGWTQENASENLFVFSIYLKDGRKWTREYDRKTCVFISQRFYSVDHIAKANLANKLS